MEKYRVVHDLFEGGESPEYERECMERGHVVAVLAYDAVQDTVILIEQFRVGALDREAGPWLREIIAGMMDGETDCEAVTRREAMEEAGCELGELVKICDYYVSPGGITEKVALYCGQVDSDGIGGVHGLDHENEDIRVDVVDRNAAFNMIADGRVDSAASIIALQWLQMNYSDLRGRWT